MEEYATSGHWSNDAYGQVWNVFLPSKSRSRRAVVRAAVAGSFAAAAMGSQTGDSLYAPASGASLVTLRGTDGLESGTGIQPLTWMTDFGGAMTRSVADLADILNIVTVPVREDPATCRLFGRPASPADWRTVINVNALQGKRIGYVDSAWADVFQPVLPSGSPLPPPGAIHPSDNPAIVKEAAAQYLMDAGATLVRMGQLRRSVDLRRSDSVSRCPTNAPAQPIPGAK